MKTFYKIKILRETKVYKDETYTASDFMETIINMNHIMFIRINKNNPKMYDVVLCNNNVHVIINKESFIILTEEVE